MAEINDLNIADASNTARFPENQAPSSVNDGARALEGMIARWHKDTNASIAAGGTGDAITVAANQTLSAYYDGLVIAFEATAANTTATTLNVDSVGAKAIRKHFNAALVADDIKIGQKVICIFDSSADYWQMITHLGNAPYSPGGTDVAVADGGTGVSTLTGIVKGSGTSAFSAASDGTDYLSPTTGRKQGLETIWVPASAMYGRTTNGAASGTVETGTSLVMRKSLDFDTTTQEFAQFAVMFPKSWNEGTVTFSPVWTAASGSGGVVFVLAGVALSDDDALNTAFGTAQTSTDTLITAADVHVGPTSSAITIAGTPAAGDWVAFQVNRTVSDGSDTLGVDANLLGVRLFFTTDGSDDT